MAGATPQQTEQARPVLLTVVRNITPVLATAITYALARSNIHLLRNVTVETIINIVISAVAGLVWTAVFRWLEAHKSTWWGKAFLIADATPESAIPPDPPVVIATTADRPTARAIEKG
jgi:hypothetical protein